MLSAAAEQQFETLGSQALAQPNLVLRQGGRDTTAPTGFLEKAPRSREDHMLSDVDDLADNVRPDGSYDPVALASIRQNKNTLVLEAMPDAVSEVRQQWIPSPKGKGGLVMDLGRTAVETAIRGESWYRHTESKARGKVEVKHAIHKQENLRPGIALVKVSAKMSREDGPLEIAKAEGVADADSIQIDWLDLDETGQSGKAVTQCILVPDVPTEAWADWLADPDNIFKKSIAVRSRHSGLAIMEAYDGMEVSLDELPEGPITIFAAVVPYIKDPVIRAKVAAHVERFRSTDQVALHAKAESPTERLLQFDISTDQSLRAQVANSELRYFINSLDDRWGNNDREVIDAHRTGDGQFVMTRQLAAVLQNAQRNMILSAAAVVGGNQAVLDQLPREAAQAIHRQEMAIQAAHRAGLPIHLLLTGMNKLIARFNIKVAGGCNGENKADFKVPGLEDAETSNESSGKRDKKGSLIFECKNGHTNERPWGETIPCCTTCGVDVECAPKPGKGVFAKILGKLSLGKLSNAV